MTREQWQKIGGAREVLGLAEQASLLEIKQAYRRLSKQHHPDLAAGSLPASGTKMQELAEAYRILLDYVERCRLPMAPPEEEPLAAEDWWMDRFGRDPLWSKG